MPSTSATPCPKVKEEGLAWARQCGFVSTVVRAYFSGSRLICLGFFDRPVCSMFPLSIGTGEELFVMDI